MEGSEEKNDGYIFSKSVHGKNLSGKEKIWVLLENDANVFTDYTDEKGRLLFRLKSCVDTFPYEFKEIEPETGKEVATAFSVTEKRIVSYNPALAKKQKTEIMKMAGKASAYTTYKKMAREDLGDSVKYIKVTNKDKDGKKIEPLIGIDQDKIDEDLKYAGYNLLVTSELSMDPLQIYHTYHGLWKIEESFRITKSYLDARPVYVQKIVSSLVNDIFMPLLSIFTGKINFNNLVIILESGDNAATINYGTFLTQVVNFLVVRQINKLRSLHTQEEVKEETEKECPFCKTKISIHATRCPHCTSVLEDTGAAQPNMEK